MVPGIKKFAVVLALLVNSAMGLTPAPCSGEGCKANHKVKHIATGARDPPKTNAPQSLFTKRNLAIGGLGVLALVGVGAAFYLKGNKPKVAEAVAKVGDDDGDDDGGDDKLPDGDLKPGAGGVKSFLDLL